MIDPPDFSLAKLSAGIFGSLVSLRFMQGSYTERILMSIGGAALSYFATTPIADWLNVSKAEGLIGFLVGLFGMALVGKVYEVILLLDAAAIATDVWAAIKRKWGA